MNVHCIVLHATYGRIHDALGWGYYVTGDMVGSENNGMDDGRQLLVIANAWFGL